MTILSILDTQNIEIRLIREEQLLELEINVPTPGSLPDLVTSEQTKITSSLTLTGYINANDLLFIRDSFDVLIKLNLEKVNIEKDNIPYGALMNCGALQELLLPDSLKILSPNSLIGIPGVEKIILPPNIEKIGFNAFFFNNGLKKIVVRNPIPLKLNDDPFFGHPALRYTNLRQWGVLYVPKGSKKDYETAKYWQDFARIIEYDSIAGIQEDGPDEMTVKCISDGLLYSYIFDNQYNIIKKLTLLGNPGVSDFHHVSDNLKCLQYLNLKKAKPSESYYLPGGLYNLNALKTLILPDSLRGFSAYALNSGSLESLVIPKTVQEITDRTSFYGCDSLYKLYMRNSQPFTLSEDVFANCPRLKKEGILYVPYGSKPTYDTAQYWKDIPNIVEYGFLRVLPDEDDGTATPTVSFVIDKEAEYDLIHVCLVDSTTKNDTLVNVYLDKRSVSYTFDSLPNGAYNAVFELCTVNEDYDTVAIELGSYNLSFRIFYIPFEPVKTPVAIASVRRGDKVELFCSSRRSKIYYGIGEKAVPTIEYTEGIVINEPTYVRSMSLVPGKDTSDIMTTLYYVVAPDTVTLTVSDTLWLTDTVTIVVHDTVILEPGENIYNDGSKGLPGVNIYPNPTSGTFNVDVPVDGAVEMYDAKGSRLWRKDITVGVQTYNLPNSGVYFVRVISRDGRTAVKRVVVR